MDDAHTLEVEAEVSKGEVAKSSGFGIAVMVEQLDDPARATKSHHEKCQTKFCTVLQPSVTQPSSDTGELVRRDDGIGVIDNSCEG